VESESLPDVLQESLQELTTTASPSGWQRVKQDTLTNQLIRAGIVELVGSRLVFPTRPAPLASYLARGGLDPQWPWIRFTYWPGTVQRAGISRNNLNGGDQETRDRMDGRGTGSATADEHSETGSRLCSRSTSTWKSSFMPDGRRPLLQDGRPAPVEN